MTASDDGRLKPWSLTVEERARLGALAWHWNETELLSTRSIAKRLHEREGIRVSHVWVAKALNDARDQAKILELYGPAQVRAGQIGRIEQYLEFFMGEVGGYALTPIEIRERALRLAAASSPSHSALTGSAGSVALAGQGRAAA